MKLRVAIKVNRAVWGYHQRSPRAFARHARHMEQNPRLGHSAKTAFRSLAVLRKHRIRPDDLYGPFGGD